MPTEVYREHAPYGLVERGTAERVGKKRGAVSRNSCLEEEVRSGGALKPGDYPLAQTFPAIGTARLTQLQQVPRSEK